MKTKVKGWAIPEWIELTGKDVSEVHDGVCSCEFREANCVGLYGCAHISTPGIYMRVDILRKNMGDKFPEAWDENKLSPLNTEQWNLRDAAIKKLGKEYFKKCVPVCVSVQKR